jgi:hypothetical protein
MMSYIREGLKHMNGLRKLPDARAVLFFMEGIGFSEFQMGAKSPVFVRGDADRRVRHPGGVESLLWPASAKMFGLAC